MAPKGTSLGTALFVVAFAIWCSPVALRQWIWDYIAYVVFGQWIQFVTIYFQPWNWMHNCEFEKWFVFWFSITFTPGGQTHNTNTQTEERKGGRAEQITATGSMRRRVIAAVLRLRCFVCSLLRVWFSLSSSPS